MEAYRYLAEVYDALMTDVDTDGWTAYIDALLMKHGARRVLDAACGTGRITRALVRHGYDMIASDVSEGMIRTAQREARRHGSSITFLIQDMRYIEVGNPVDAVISTCDGVNYLDREGTEMFALSAYRALKPGGILLFDISTRYKLKEEMDGQLYYDDGEDATCIWNCEYNESREALTMDVTLFIRRGTLFERMSEQHIQYAHTQEALRDVMIDAGFSSIDVYNCFSFNGPKYDSKRFQFLCVK